MKLSKDSMRAIKAKAKQKGCTENEAADKLIATAAGRNAAIVRYAEAQVKKAKAKAKKRKPAKKKAPAKAKRKAAAAAKPRAKVPAKKKASKPRVRKPKAPKAAPVVDVTPEAEAAE